MSRSELATLLDDLVRRKRITRAEADKMLADFDAGIEVAVDPPQADNDDWLAAFALLLLLVRGSPRRRLTPQRGSQARRLLRGNFDATMRKLANQVTSGALSVPAWQRQMQGALSVYTRQMAIAGRGQLPSVAMRRLVDARLAEQWPFLNRFALEQMARANGGRPMSERQIAARARSYGATAWGAYFEGQGEGAEPGMVDQWISRDDRRTCRVCAPRHLQYFLPGSPPYPGWDCLGLCRCARVQVFAPDIYAQLTGQAQRRAA